MRPSDCRTPADVTELAHRMFGGAPFGPGVVHVTALWSDPSDGHRTIRIGRASPKSEHDLFALSFARARADAIVITGQVLRDEPELRVEVSGASAAALLRWRGQDDPPRLVVLTSGDRRIDPGHPALHGWTRPLIFTGRDAAPWSGVPVVQQDRPSLRGAIEWLRGEGARVISVEAGPTSSRALYEEPVVVDELMLSVFEGPLEVSLRGPPLLADGVIEERLPRASAEYSVSEPSGRWTFRRRAR